MKHEDASTLKHFWEKKMDIEGWVGFDRERLAKDFPDLFKAWDAYKASVEAMNDAVANL